MSGEKTLHLLLLDDFFFEVGFNARPVNLTYINFLRWFFKGHLDALVHELSLVLHTVTDIGEHIAASRELGLTHGFARLEARYTLLTSLNSFAFMKSCILNILVNYGCLLCLGEGQLGRDNRVGVTVTARDEDLGLAS